jgi:hypothetical protein
MAARSSERPSTSRCSQARKARQFTGPAPESRWLRMVSKRPVSQHDGHLPGAKLHRSAESEKASYTRGHMQEPTRSRQWLPGRATREGLLRDGYQPRSKRPLRVVGLSDRMDGHQDILDRIFQIAGRFQISEGDRPDVGLNLREQTTIGFAVAILSARHEHRPLPPGSLAGDRRRLTNQRELGSIWVWGMFLAATRHPECFSRPDALFGYTRPLGDDRKQFSAGPLTFAAAASNLQS